MSGQRAWGSTELGDEDREYLDPDPYRHDAVGWDLAERDWRNTLAAQDGDAGLSIYQRAGLDEWAFVDDFEPWDPPEDRREVE